MRTVTIVTNENGAFLSTLANVETFSAELNATEDELVAALDALLSAGEWQLIECLVQDSYTGLSAGEWQRVADAIYDARALAA